MPVFCPVDSLDTRPFNLHPDFSRVPPHPDFSRVLSEIFLGVASALFFQGGSLEKAGFHTKSEENQVRTLEKLGRGGTL